MARGLSVLVGSVAQLLGSNLGWLTDGELGAGVGGADDFTCLWLWASFLQSEGENSSLVWGASVNRVCAEGPWIGYYDYCYFRILILVLSLYWGNPRECLLHLWELGGSDGGGPQDGEGPGLSPLSTGRHGVGSQLSCSEWWRGGECISGTA